MDLQRNTEYLGNDVCISRSKYSLTKISYLTFPLFFFSDSKNRVPTPEEQENAIYMVICIDLYKYR